VFQPSPAITFAPAVEEQIAEPPTTQIPIPVRTGIRIRLRDSLGLGQGDDSGTQQEDKVLNDLCICIV